MVWYRRSKGSRRKWGMKMKVIFVKDYDEMSEKTYELIAQVVKENEEPIVGLTTGGTPRGLMKLLVERVNANELDLSNTSIVT